jgi:hypothetical protein
MTRTYAGEEGFNAHDDRPFGIQSSPEEAERLDALERRNAEAGFDLYGSPLEEPS